MKKVKYYVSMYCILYMVLTLLSSTLALIMGRETDTHLHLLYRGVVTFIGIAIIIIMDNIKLENKILSTLIQYVISLSLVFVVVWLSGFIDPVHPNGYRDVFLNFTGIFIIIIPILGLIEKRKQNKKRARLALFCNRTPFRKSYKNRLY
ncbi:hypothetical protein CON22_24740 [Bacillus cereus]|nr:hypothetical protein CON22_24740 [Bacillus cereus]